MPADPPEIPVDLSTLKIAEKKSLFRKQRDYIEQCQKEKRKALRSDPTCAEFLSKEIYTAECELQRIRRSILPPLRRIL